MAKGPVSPVVLDFLARVQQEALKLEFVEEYAPWGNRAFFRELKGRDFLFLTEKPDFLEVQVCLPPPEKTRALQQPFVEKHPWGDRRGWVLAKVSTLNELEAVLPWIELSYTRSKPFRTSADLLPGESLLVLDFLIQARKVANAYPDIEEYFPYGSRAFRPLGGKIFLYTTEFDDALYLIVKPSPITKDYALTLPYVDIPKYFGPSGWIGVTCANQEELENGLLWLEESYKITNPPKKSRTRKA